ncbi:MAG: VCBS repeat-containing protein [Natronospirillum sp.]|uniref:FG-GAP repeat domain-containing protein n=1 Tax=Natronospirillum sp. TaxID=2812955 RepID=UPI0025D88FB3|nr:VCBS repeat-containing protein [Natronospirillum sp.]MCH8551826.1 VCBS repeat-containing protein [Natronospirillum sp.]
MVKPFRNILRKRWQATALALAGSLGTQAVASISSDDFLGYPTHNRPVHIDLNGNGQADIFKIWNEDGHVNIDAHLSDGQSFNIHRWATQQAAFLDGMRWFAGDFNGNGKTDIVRVWNHEGQAAMVLQLSTGQSFELQHWSTHQGGYVDSMQWFVADFTGDGQDELLKIWAHEDHLYADVHMSNGTQFDHFERWASHQGGMWESMQWLVGDFTGNGKTDLMKVWPEQGMVNADVHVSTGSSFDIQRWGTHQGGYSDYMKWSVADFTGNGRDDLLKFVEHEGGLYADVHVSTGTSFDHQSWALHQGAVTDDMQWFVGDFNGSGRYDLMKIWPDHGQMVSDVHVSTGHSFEHQRWATHQGGMWETMQWAVGDYTGNGRYDLVKVWDEEGQMNSQVHTSTGHSFELENWAYNQGGIWPEQMWSVNPGNIQGRSMAEHQRGEALLHTFANHLRRLPGKAEFDYWFNVPNTNTEIVTALVNSEEAQRKAEIGALFVSYLGRIAPAHEVNYWHNTGSSLQDIEMMLAGTDEHRQLMVSHIYGLYLGREPSADDMAYWLNSEYDVPDIVNQIWQSEERQQVREQPHRREFEIRLLYGTYLGRKPNTDEVDHHMHSGYSIAQKVDIFLDSPERRELVTQMLVNLGHEPLDVHVDEMRLSQAAVEQLPMLIEEYMIFYEAEQEAIQQAAEEAHRENLRAQVRAMGERAMHGPTWMERQQAEFTAQWHSNHQETIAMQEQLSARMRAEFQASVDAWRAESDAFWERNRQIVMANYARHVVTNEMYRQELGISGSTPTNSLGIDFNAIEPIGVDTLGTQESTLSILSDQPGTLVASADPLLLGDPMEYSRPYMSPLESQTQVTTPDYNKVPVVEDPRGMNTEAGNMDFMPNNRSGGYSAGFQGLSVYDRTSDGTFLDQNLTREFREGYTQGLIMRGLFDVVLPFRSINNSAARQYQNYNYDPSSPSPEGTSPTPSWFSPRNMQNNPSQH